MSQLLSFFYKSALYRSIHAGWRAVVVLSEVSNMQHNTFRTVITLGLLLIGLAFVYFSSHFEQAYGESTSQAAFTYVADFDYWQRTPREQIVHATSAFDLGHDLNEVPLTVGEWQGQEIPQTNIGVFMVLEPEQYVERLYRNQKGQYLWLTMIGGRSSRTFHRPEDCYSSYDWQTEHDLPKRSWCGSTC